MVIEMMSLLILTVFLALFLGIIDRIFGRKTPREMLRMRQRSGALSDEGWELLGQFKEQYGTPIAMIAPVLSALDERLRIRFPQLPALPTSVPRRLPDLPALPFASQRLAMLEQSGALEQGLQQQAQALQASGFRGSSLARAMMGARMGTMMNRERMLADLALQEYMMERQREEQTFQRDLQNYGIDLQQYNLQREHQLQQLQQELQRQQLREGAQKERFNLLMALRGGLQEQTVKGGAMSAESALQAQQLASQEMMGLMQGIGSLAGAYAQYRQNQEMLRTMQGLFQQRSAPMPSAPASPPVSIPFFNPSARIVF
jgi:hypothetical protein